MLPGQGSQLYIHFIAWISVITAAKVFILYAKIIKQCMVDWYILDRERNEASVHRIIRDLKVPHEKNA